MQCGPTVGRKGGGVMTAIETSVPTIPVTRLDQADPVLLEELLEVVARVARSGAFTMGHELEAFEQEFAAYCGSDHAVGVSYGTDAISLALRALEIGPGDEVIVPTNSFIATAEAVSWVGATPRLVDVDPQTHLITAEAVEAAIGPRTRAVIPVHLMGSTVDIDRDHRGRARRRPPRDRGHGPGARRRYRGRRAGVDRRLRLLLVLPDQEPRRVGRRRRGRHRTTRRSRTGSGCCARTARSPRYHHRIVGTTARLDALQAALLRVKLRRLDARNDDRRRLGSGAARRASRARPSSFRRRPSRAPTTCTTCSSCARGSATRCARTCDAHGVSSAVHYPFPIHRTEAYAATGRAKAACPSPSGWREEICTLPLFPTMSDDGGRAGRRRGRRASRHEE